MKDEGWIKMKKKTQTEKTTKAKLILRARYLLPLPVEDLFMISTVILALPMINFVFIKDQH